LSAKQRSLGRIGPRWEGCGIVQIMGGMVIALFRVGRDSEKTKKPPALVRMTT